MAGSLVLATVSHLWSAMKALISDSLHYGHFTVSDKALSVIKSAAGRTNCLLVALVLLTFLLSSLFASWLFDYLSWGPIGEAVLISMFFICLSIWAFI